MQIRTGQVVTVILTGTDRAYRVSYPCYHPQNRCPLAASCGILLFYYSISNKLVSHILHRNGVSAVCQKYLPTAENLKSNQKGPLTSTSSSSFLFCFPEPTGSTPYHVITFHTGDKHRRECSSSCAGWPRSGCTPPLLSTL
jgi:hypothetical protein